jgi:hypothetical protein
MNHDRIVIGYAFFLPNSFKCCDFVKTRVGLDKSSFRMANSLAVKDFFVHPLLLQNGRIEFYIAMSKPNILLKYKSSL